MQEYIAIIMAVTLQYKDLCIEVFDDASFSALPDILSTYDKIYQSEASKPYIARSKHAIVVYKDGIKLHSAILLEAGGATSVTDDSVILHNEKLFVRCSNYIFCLELPNLQLNWKTEADWATCFSIHAYEDDIIAHGEMSITRIDKNGNIAWSYSGGDIFITPDGSASFTMHDNFIEARDFSYNIYRIGYNGETIVYIEQKSSERKNIFPDSKKEWWKFWKR